MTNIHPTRLTCEYAENPLGIDERAPRLSWQLEGDGPNRRQTAYQVLVATTPELLAADQGNLWDTGRVDSEDNVHIAYQGEPLRSRQRCYWKVRVWDESGEVSAYSEPAYWEMGLLAASDFRGSWIGVDTAYPSTPPTLEGCVSMRIPGDAGVIVPWTLYEEYGDIRILECHYDAMARWITYLQEHSEGLLRPAQGYGDWLSVDSTTPKDVLATAFFAYSTQLVAQAAEVLGRQADAVRYRSLWGEIRDAFQQAYVREDGTITGETQTCYVLALHMNLLPQELREAAIQHLVRDIEARGGRMTTGFVGTQLLLPVLTKAGRVDVVHRLVRADHFPSWGYSIRNGATTMLERWDSYRKDKGFGDLGMNSFNHYAFGSVGEWLYGYLAGIRVDAKQPGYKHTLIQPHPGGGFTRVRAEYGSIQGRIVSEWSLENGLFTLNVVVPANTTATVYVPTAPQHPITERNRSVEAAPDLEYKGIEDGCAVVSVPSGAYRFVSRAPAE